MYTDFNIEHSPRELPILIVPYQHATCKAYFQHYSTVFYYVNKGRCVVY